MVVATTVGRTRPVGGWPVVAAFVVGTVGAGLVVGLLNDPGAWYRALEKPPLTSPSAVFGPVWTVLYVMVGLAGALLWRSTGRGRAPALGAWAVQLALNLAWSVVFFGLGRPGWAVVEIVVLLAAVVVTALLARRLSRPAAALLLPYLAWVGFATYLTAGIVVLG